MAKKLVSKSDYVLDMGTGGGEIFSQFAPFPKHTVATEGYTPNIALARKRLGPLGVRIVDFKKTTVRKMPFLTEEFDLVLNRHDAFDIQEVHRILKNNGIFLTQQVGRNNLSDLVKAFNAQTKYRIREFRVLRKSIRDAGLSIIKSRKWQGKTEFRDVGAIVFFLTSVPWIVPGFCVDTHMRYLERLQKQKDNGKKLVFTEERYMFLAAK